MSQFQWNEKTIAELRQLWSEGLACSAIANKLGTTSSAVIGKVHRLGIEYRKPKSNSFVGGFHSNGRKRKASQPMPEIAETVGEDPVSIFDVTTYQCRYPLNSAEPISEFRFCGGETKEPFGYCSEHSK